MAIRYYQQYRTRDIRMKDFSQVFTKQTFKRFYARLTGLHRDAFAAMSVAEMCCEIIKYWMLNSHAVLPLAELGGRARLEGIFQWILIENGVKVRDGNEWFKSKKCQTAFDKVLRRYENNFSTVCSSYGELFNVMAKLQKNSKEFSEVTPLMPHIVPLSRIMPINAKDMFDGDKVIEKAIRDTLLGKGLAVNIVATEIAFPLKWAKIARQVAAEEADTPVIFRQLLKEGEFRRRIPSSAVINPEDCYISDSSAALQMLIETTDKMGKLLSPPAKKESKMTLTPGADPK